MKNKHVAGRLAKFAVGSVLALAFAGTAMAETSTSTPQSRRKT